MTSEEFTKLKRGDIVVNQGTGNSYIVEEAITRETKILIRVIIASNPNEWELVKTRRKFGYTTL